VELMTSYVTIPRAVVDRALRKARAEYTRLTEDAEPGECWAEFEALADAIADLPEPVRADYPDGYAYARARADWVRNRRGATQ